MFTPEQIRSGESAGRSSDCSSSDDEERFGDGRAEQRLFMQRSSPLAVEWRNNDQNKQNDSQRL